MVNSLYYIFHTVHAVFVVVMVKYVQFSPVSSAMGLSFWTDDD